VWGIERERIGPANCLLGAAYCGHIRNASHVRAVTASDLLVSAVEVQFTMSRLADEILEIEKSFWTRADDPRVFEENMAEEVISVIEPAGFIEKPQAVKMAADKPYRDVEMQDVVVHQVTPDCVILAYHGQGSRDGDQEPYRGSIASTYVKQNGRWQLALTAHQPWKPKETAA
jgi:hypothetical protein